MPAEYFDVLIMGAGLSGIDAAYHLTKNCPNKSYVILEQRERIGGTWDLFRYPGIRSDSDMQTMGYSFRPWTKPKAISPGDDIRDYITSTVPIIVVTAEPRAADIDRLDRIGADSILAKPAAPDRLLDEVRRLIAVGRTLPRDHAGTSDPAPAPPVRRTKRIALTKLHQRFATTEPPASPPSLFCPSCDRPLVYEHSDIGGVSSKNGEQWDTFTCASCGRFEYRHRTRKLRQVP